MEKTYKSKLHGYNIVVSVDGQKKNIIFKKDFIGISTMIGCVYKTGDAKLQQAIEAHRDFGQLFWTDDVVEVHKAQAEDPEKEEKREKKSATKQE